MTWIFFTLWNVLGNGTAAFILKQQTKRGKMPYVTLMFLALFFASLTLLPIFLFLFIQSPILFTNNIGWPLFVGSVIFNICAWYFLIKAISLNDLSTYGPLETLRPFFVVILSLIFLHQQPTLFLLFGITSIVIGSSILHLQRSLGKFIRAVFASKATLSVIFSTFFFSITSIIDRVTLTYVDPIIYSFLLITGITIGFYFLSIENRNVLLSKRVLQIPLIIAGILLGFATIGIIIALKLATPNVVIPMQMTRALYLSILGFVFLKEKDYTKKIIAAILMLIGVFLITR